MPLKRPFLLGGLELPSNIFCAPLAGCSDLPFRVMTTRYRPGITFCEMVKIDALVRHDPHTYRLLNYLPEMHPIGAQICGSKPLLAAASAKIIEDLGFDLIDLNCGCPVDKVTKDGSGSGLLRTPDRIGEILRAVIEAVKIPVTLKIRAGWDESSIQAPLIAQIAEQAGAAAITVHGRTREQGYQGLANRDYILACKAVTKHLPVIGNGDIFDAASAASMFEETGCDGILVARGTLGQPWIIEDIYRHLAGEAPLPRTIEDVRCHLMDHFEWIVRYQGEKQALLDMRRVGCWYLKPCQGAKALRMEINQATTLREVFALLERANWQELGFQS